MAESDEQEGKLSAMAAELRAKGFAEEVSAADRSFRVKFDEIIRRQEEGVSLDQGTADVREAIAEYHTALTKLMSQGAKKEGQKQEEKTPVRTGGQDKWNSDLASIQRDLEDIGGLRGVTIDIFSISPYRRAGQTEKNTTFIMSWAPKRCLVLSVSQSEKGLIDAFSAILGYEPFCRYTSKLSGMLTYEWDSQDAEGRLAELKKDGEKGIERIRAN
jgi:hypothetical protein